MTKSERGPHGDQIAVEYGEEREQELWDHRADRLAKLIRLKAPRIIIVHSTLILLAHHGMWDAIKFWLKTHYWNQWKYTAWYAWHKHILRHTDKEIENLILEGK